MIHRRVHDSIYNSDTDCRRINVEVGGGGEVVQEEALG